MFPRPIIAALAALLLSCLPAAGQNVRQLFADMPDEVLPYIDRSTRLDLIDFYDSGMKARLNNRLNEPVTLTRLSDTHLSLELSGITRLELAVLPAGKDSVLCLVQTLLRPFAESRVTFYDNRWRPVASAKRHLALPAAADWVQPEAGPAERKALARQLGQEGWLHTTATLSDDGAQLVLTPHVQTLDPDQQVALQSRLRPTLTLRWQKGRFQ